MTKRSSRVSSTKKLSEESEILLFTTEIKDKISEVTEEIVKRLKKEDASELEKS